MKEPSRKLIALPKLLYVKLEATHHDPSDVLLVAAETLDDMKDGEVVGVYTLSVTQTARVTRALE